MKKTYHILAAMLVIFSMGYIATPIFAQGNNNTISLAPNFWFQDGGINPLPTGPNPGQFQDYDGSPANNTHASIQDEDGNVLFFVVDGTIYDAEGYLIQQLEVNDPGAGGSLLMSGVSETLIIPDPFDCNRYYIFAVALEGVITNTEPAWIPFFTVLDLSLESNEYPNRFGAIDSDAITNPTSSLWGEPISQLIPDFFDLVGDGPGGGGLKNIYFAAPKQAECKDRQFVYMSTGVGVFQLEITPSGVVYNPEMIEFPFATTNVTGMRAEMEVIELPDESHRLAVPYNYAEIPGSPHRKLPYSSLILIVMVISSLTVMIFSFFREVHRANDHLSMV